MIIGSPLKVMENAFYFTLKALFVLLITGSPLKEMENAFYFTLKALFVLKIFKFLSLHFGHVEKTARLER